MPTSGIAESYGSCYFLFLKEPTLILCVSLQLKHIVGSICWTLFFKKSISPFIPFGWITEFIYI